MAAPTTSRSHTRFSPTLALVADTVRVARRDDLDVMLFPIIRLSAPKPGEWRGTLAPRDRNRWFRNYGEALGELAAIAAVTGAKRMVVGSELSTLDGPGDVERWRADRRPHARDLRRQAGLLGQLGPLSRDRALRARR